MSVAAVKLLVIDAIRKTLSASGAASSPTRNVPMPRTWISSPSRTTPYATPGTCRPIEEAVGRGVRGAQGGGASAGSAVVSIGAESSGAMRPGCGRGARA